MKPLAIYFNEISLQGTLTDTEWSKSTETLFHVLNDFLQLRSDGQIIFVSDHWASSCGGIPLARQFEQLKHRHKTQYQRFISKVKKINKTLNLMQEITWQNQVADGLTLATLNGSWCFSIIDSHSNWFLEKIPAQRHEMDEAGGISSAACEVNHLASLAHLAAWKVSLQDWGATIAASCVLDSLKGHHVVMYSAPLEHNPPHVHVLHKGSGDTLARYRIEDGAREDGKPTLDAEMRIWLTKYKDQLLRSWTRCQRGGHPYELNKPTASP